MSLTVDDITRLVRLGAPILCLDTCSILDVMRDPTRDSARAQDAQAALDLLGALETGSGLIGLLAEQVSLEFTEHVDRIEDEAEQALNKLKDRIKRIDAITTVFGASANTNLLHLDAHVKRARVVVNRWIAAATSTNQSSDVASRALFRLNQARTPARKGKDSMKDCVVIETYLEEISCLRSAGLTSNIVFVSSNVKDYTNDSGSHLRPDLAAEFATLKIEYATNLGMAKHLLGL